MPYGIGGTGTGKSTGSYVDEFFPGYTESLSRIRGGQERLTRELIGSQEDLNKQVQTAFAAMESAQQPTKFDKAGDAALALAAIADLAKGGRKGSLASEKFREFRTARKGEQSQKREEARTRLGSRLKLAEFGGDIKARNIQALLGLGEQDAADLQNKISIALKGAESKADIGYKKAATKALEGKEPSPEEKRQAGQREIAKLISDQVDKEFGTYDPDKHAEFDGFRGWLAAKNARIKELHDMYYPPRPEPKDPASFLGLDIPLQENTVIPTSEYPVGHNISPQSGAFRSAGAGVMDLLNKLSQMYLPNQR